MDIHSKAQLLTVLEMQLNLLETPALKPCSQSFPAAHLCLKLFQHFAYRLQDQGDIVELVKKILLQEHLRITGPILKMISLKAPFGLSIATHINRELLLSEVLRKKHNASLDGPAFIAFTKKEWDEYNAFILFRAAWECFTLLLWPELAPASSRKAPSPGQNGVNKDDESFDVYQTLHEVSTALGRKGYYVSDCYPKLRIDRLPFCSLFPAIVVEGAEPWCSAPIL
ncbi:hypothetical protein [Olivibacter domesticus]|uniref:Uncharacterized protein n=1 Tax=Olivibacter domesticus TaxID=407022 RepID=A0A1H7IH85_OLID1|nr:hypothetical protein [Olivibacter domesticus]SEK61127.1 hypothetical protein SAMN05661044_00682 [Olivibacter domesticus]